MSKWATGPAIIIIFATSAYVAFLHPDYVLAVSRWLFIPGWFLALLVLTPAGRMRMGATPRMAFITWLLKITALQAVLLGLFVAFTIAIVGNGPVYMLGHLDSSEAIFALTSYYPRGWGLFPWSLMLFWAIYLSYCVYIKRTGPHIYHALTKVIPVFFQPVVKAASDGCLTGVTSIFFALTAGTTVLLFVYVVEFFFPLQHLLLPAISSVFLSFFMPFILLPAFRRRLKSGFGLSFQLSRFYTVVIFIFVSMLIGAGLLNHWLFTNVKDISALGQVHIVEFLYQNPKTRFSGLFLAWWLLVTPLAGSYIAKISQGRTFRQMILGFLFLPGLLFCLSMWFGVGMWQQLVLTILNFANPMVLLALAVFNLWTLRHITRKQHNNGLFTRGLLNINDEKQSRVYLSQASKTRGLGSFSLHMFYGVMGVCMLHSIGGWYLLQIQMLAVAPVTLIYAFELFVIFMVFLFKDKIWLNNQNIAPLNSTSKRSFQEIQA